MFTVSSKLPYLLPLVTPAEGCHPNTGDMSETHLFDNMLGFIVSNQDSDAVVAV